MYYRVTLINDEKDKSAADIIWVEEEAFFYVTSNNMKLRNTLERILSSDAYILAPGVSLPGYASDGVVYIPQGSAYHFDAIPEILAWRGYKAVFHGEVHKSMIVNTHKTLKAAGGDGIRISDAPGTAGDRIVERVPNGYIAINTQTGAYLTAGKWLNANIDKEDAVWVLQENPYEAQTEEDRSKAWRAMRTGKLAYHPGAFEQAYKEEFKDRLEDAFLRRYTEGLPGTKRLSELFPKEEEKAEAAQPAPQNFQKPEERAVLFSPELGLAFDTVIFDEAIKHLQENHPGFEDNAWYAMPYPAGVEPSDRWRKVANARGRRNDPLRTWGVDKDVQKVDIADDSPFLDMATEWDLVDRPSGDHDIQLNEEVRRLPLPIMGERGKSVMVDIKRRLSSYVNAMRKILPDGRTRRYDPAGAASLHVDGLYTTDDDDVPEDAAVLQGNFTGREYQRAMIAAVTDISQYEAFGGPRGLHGHLLNASYGIGKTIIGIGSWLTLRNKRVEGEPIVKLGEQTLLISAPTRNTSVWHAEYAQFAGEEAVVVKGSRPQRQAIWEDLINRARDGNLPSAIIVPTSFFRTEHPERDADGNLLEHLSPDAVMDAQMLKLLMRGGKLGDTEVPGKHVAQMILDESGQYVNYDTGRQRVLREVLDDLYVSGGISTTMNGDVTGNSATDMISEASFINARVRDNFNALNSRYTKSIAKEYKTQDGKVKKGGRSTRRTWETSASVEEFAELYAPNITRLEGEFVAGDRYGLYYTEDTVAEMGANWGSVYAQGIDSLTSAIYSSDKEVRSRALGLQAVIIGASYGSTHPARLLDYGLGDDKILEGLSHLGYDAATLEAARKAISEYQSEVTGMEGGAEGSGVRLPAKGMSTGERDEQYYDILGDYADDIEKVISSWDVPAIDEIVDGLREEMKNKRTMSDSNLKLGVGGFSKRAIERIHAKLSEEFGNEVQINLITGDTTADDVEKIGQRHRDEKDKDVITLVTAAAKYGLSLPADRSWRFPMWNPATGKQMTGRFHRKPEQQHISTIVSVGGIVQYMQYVADEKSKISNDTIRGIMNSDSFWQALEDGGGDVTTELEFNPDEFVTFMNALSGSDFSPTTLEKEMRQMTPASREKVREARAKDRNVKLDKVLAERAERLARAEKEEADAKAAAAKRRRRQRRTAPSQAPAVPDAPTPPAPVKKSVSQPAAKRVHDTPTMAKNPLYKESKDSN